MPVQNTHWKVSVYSLWARAQAAQAYRADDRRPFASRQVVQCQLQPVRREEADVTNCAKLRSVGSLGMVRATLTSCATARSSPGRSCGDRLARSAPPVDDAAATAREARAPGRRRQHCYVGPELLVGPELPGSGYGTGWWYTHTPSPTTTT